MQTQGKYHQYQFASKINATFGGQEFTGEDLTRNGIGMASGHIHGLVTIGVLSRVRGKKENRYQLQDNRFQNLRRRWE